jgi:hypothetical protein
MEYRRRGLDRGVDREIRNEILFPHAEEDECPRHLKLVIFVLAIIYGLTKIYFTFC